MKKEKLRTKLKSFGFQMAIFYLVAGIILLGLFGGVVYTLVSDIFVKEAVSKTQMAIEKDANGIGEYVRHAKSLLQIYAKDPTFVGFVTAPSEEEEGKILSQMTTIMESDAHIFEVFMLLSDGQIIGNHERQSNAILPNIDTQKPCVSRERANEYGHKDPWILTIGVPILDAQGKDRGVLAMDLDYCLFMHRVSSPEIGSVSILNEKGTLVFDTSKNDLTLGEEGVAPSNENPNGYDPKANELTHSVAIPGTNWTMVGKTSLDGLDVLKRQLFDMVVFTGILLFLVLLGITATISKKLTAPLSRLAQSMEDIENLAQLKVYKNEASEATILTESYNHMIQRIKELMQALKEKQGELRKYELDVLTSQINPHFLYNTLDTIVWLAEFRDNDKIIALTQSLAAFFRLSLNGGKVVVTLQDEIEHVKQYLFIQKERYDDKLTYSFKIDENTLEYMVPKIILQPLVENAIYHGIKPMDGTGHIQIGAQVEGDALVLWVEDNGVGFNLEKNNRQSHKKTGGVGLYNVERRMKLYYGEEASLEIKASPRGGTMVRLNLKTEMLKV